MTNLSASSFNSFEICSFVVISDEMSSMLATKSVVFVATVVMPFVLSSIADEIPSTKGTL